MREALQGFLLARAGLFIDDEHGFAAAGSYFMLPRVASVRTTITLRPSSEVYQLPSLHGPNEHGFLAGGPHLGVGEARPGVNIARANFEVVTLDRRVARRRRQLLLVSVVSRTARVIFISVLSALNPPLSYITGASLATIRFAGGLAVRAEAFLRVAAPNIAVVFVRAVIHAFAAEVQAGNIRAREFEGWLIHNYALAAARRARFTAVFTS